MESAPESRDRGQAMSNIVLSNGVRQNLLALQDIGRTAEKTQVRLATGKKVNTAIDDPVNFFTSASLQGRANLLSGLMDGISNGIQTIKAASSGIDAITKLVQSAQATIRQALNDAALNRPTVKGTTTLATAAETTAVNKSAQDIALDKLVEGTATAASAGVNGSIGGAPGSTYTIQTGTTVAGTIQTYTFTTNATMTVRDLVKSINESGIATATVDSSGRFSVTGVGSDPLRFTSPAAAELQKLGLAAADATALTGATGVSVAGNSAIRSSLIEQYNSLRDQIGKLAKDAGFNGTNLLDGNILKITFNEKTGQARNSLDIQGFTITADSLGILAASNAAVANATNFQNDLDLDKADEALTTALGTMRGMSSTLGANLAVVQSRQDFTTNMMTTLKTGADNLVLADTNEEGANLLALQTRQQLSQTALSLAAQADQSVLKLFG